MLPVPIIPMELIALGTAGLTALAPELVPMIVQQGEILAPEAINVIIAIADKIWTWIQTTVENTTEDVQKDTAFTKYTKKDKENVVRYMENTEAANEFWKQLKKMSRQGIKGIGSTLYQMPEYIYNMLKVCAKYVAKAGKFVEDITLPGGKPIESVKELTETLGYSYEQFTRDEEPASVTAWADLAFIYSVLDKKIPMIHVSCTPNTDLENITEGVNDWYGTPWYDRCKHDFFIVPLKDTREKEFFTITKYTYPGNNDDWTDFASSSFGVPSMTGGFTEGVTSADFAACLTKVQREINNDLSFVFDYEKLLDLGITGIMYLPLFSVATSTSYPITSQLHSRSIYGVGADALKEFLTNTYIGGLSWKAGWTEYTKTTKITETNNTLTFPNVVLHPMQENSESGGKNNLTDSGDADWIITISGISLDGSGGTTGKITFKPWEEGQEATENGNVGFATASNTIKVNPDGSIEINGDKVGDISSLTALDLAQLLQGKAVLPELLQNVGVLADTATGTVLGTPDIRADNALDNINDKTNGYTGSIIPTGAGTAANSLMSIWNPSDAQLSSFAKKLWTKDLVDNFLKLFGNPMDACISLQKIAFNPISDGLKTLILGNYNTGVQMRHVDSQYVSMNMGGINITPKFGTYLDMDPYTQIMLYLPFIGFVPVSATMFMGHTLNVLYNAELLTGSCMAQVKREGTVIATYSGQCSMQLPITGQNYSRVISGAANGLLSGAQAGVVGSLSSGAIEAVGNLQHTLQRSGPMTVNSGFLGSFRPYVVISRPIPYSGNFQNVIGYTQNAVDRLSSFSGFCQFREVTLKSDGQATEEEMELIKNDLMNGVIL